MSSKTHNAIGLVLRSVAEKLALLGGRPYSPLAQAVLDVAVYKLGGEDDAGAGAGLGDVRYLDAYVRRGQLDRILASPWLVVGATPGGLYSAQRYRDLGGQEVPWDERPFDLVVLDEASQVNVPEALLACAFVKPSGRALLVGDHRQMPPIVAVEWNEEARAHGGGQRGLPLRLRRPPRPPPPPGGPRPQLPPPPAPGRLPGGDRRLAPPPTRLHPERGRLRSNSNSRPRLGPSAAPGAS